MRRLAVERTVNQRDVYLFPSIRLHAFRLRQLAVGNDIRIVIEINELLFPILDFILRTFV